MASAERWRGLIHFHECRFEPRSIRVHGLGLTDGRRRRDEPIELAYEFNDGMNRRLQGRQHGRIGSILTAEAHAVDPYRRRMRPRNEVRYGAVATTLLAPHQGSKN